LLSLNYSDLTANMYGNAVCSPLRKQKTTFKSNN